MRKAEIVHNLGLPTKKQVCPVCDGAGKKINPNIGAITESDRMEMGDEEFFDLIDHMRDGWYDVCCPECLGMRVIDVIDESRCTPLQIANYDEWVADMEESYAISEAERRAGA
jgi:hypothetical protein